MKKAGLICLLALICIGFSSITQQNSLFVQFRVLTIPSAESAQEIDKKIGSKNGVLEAKSDYVTSTFFCLLSPETTYTKVDFENWFSKMGYEITCFNSGMQNKDVMISPHVLKSCVEEKSE